MSNRENRVEVLAFRNGDARATVATNGVRHVMQQGEHVRDFQTLRNAIAHLEGRGFVLDNDNYRVL